MTDQVATPSQGIEGQQPVDTTTVATTPDVNVTQQGVAQEPSSQTPPVTPEVDVNALITKIRYQEEEIERQRSYAEFLKNAQQQERSGSKQKPEFDPNGVPIFSEIDEYLEYKLSEERAKMEEERLVQGLEEYGRKAMAEDPGFKERVALAGELMQFNPANMQIFLNERTVEGKVKILELLAPMHPRYNPSIAKGNVTASVQPTGVDQAIEKLKATSQMPPTLTGMASASPTTKLYSQMSPQEILAELDRVKRQA